jgi:phosphopantetheinyl transferase
MDEIVVAWGAPPRVRDGCGHLVRAVRAVTGLDLSPVRGCWSCGSVEHGAPYLAGAWGSYLGCSLTHVAGFALAAISLRRRRNGELLRGPLPVGIDAEEVTAAPDLAPALTRRILGDAEANRLGAVAPRGVERALLTAWTQKEAALKAMGSGLVVDPRQVETDPLAADRGRVRVRLPGAERDFHARSVSEDCFGRSWVVSVVTPDVPRAHRASLRVVHVP